MIPAVFYYYKMAQHPDNLLERIGKCPRGKDIACHQCNHVKIADYDSDFTFKCLDLNGDNIQVRIYSSPFKVNGVKVSITNSLLITYKDTILIDVRANVNSMNIGVSLAEYVNKEANIQPLFSEMFYDLYTTGQIMMEFHADKKP